MLRIASRIHPVSRAAQSFAFLDTHFASADPETAHRSMLAAHRIGRMALEGASVVGFGAHQLILGRFEAMLLPPIFAARDRAIECMRLPMDTTAPLAGPSGHSHSNSLLLPTLWFMHECLLAAPLASVYLGLIIFLWAPCFAGAVAGGFLGAYQAISCELRDPPRKFQR